MSLYKNWSDLHGNFITDVYILAQGTRPDPEIRTLDHDAGFGLRTPTTFAPADCIWLHFEYTESCSNVLPLTLTQI